MCQHYVSKRQEKGNVIKWKERKSCYWSRLSICYPNEIWEANIRISGKLLKNEVTWLYKLIFSFIHKNHSQILRKYLNYPISHTNGGWKRTVGHETMGPWYHDKRGMWYERHLQTPQYMSQMKLLLVSLLCIAPAFPYPYQEKLSELSFLNHLWKNTTWISSKYIWNHHLLKKHHV